MLSSISITILACDGIFFHVIIGYPGVIAVRNALRPTFQVGNVFFWSLTKTIKIYV